MASIRVTNYNGDFDTLNEVTLIGPYASGTERDADLVRLSVIDMDGGYELDPSDLVAGDAVHAPAKFANVADLDAFEAAIYDTRGV